MVACSPVGGLLLVMFVRVVFALLAVFLEPAMHGSIRHRCGLLAKLCAQAGDSDKKNAMSKAEAEQKLQIPRLQQPGS